MSFLHAVRCNFARAALEEWWNAWYRGVKLDEMLRGGERFP